MQLTCKWQWSYLLEPEDFEDEDDIGLSLTLPDSETDIVVPEPDEEFDDEADNDLDDDQDQDGSDDSSPKIFRVIRVTPWDCTDPGMDCNEADGMMIQMDDETELIPRSDAMMDIMLGIATVAVAWDAWRIQQLPMYDNSITLV